MKAALILLACLFGLSQAQLFPLHHKYGGSYYPYNKHFVGPYTPSFYNIPSVVTGRISEETPFYRVFDKEYKYDTEYPYYDKNFPYGDISKYKPYGPKGVEYKVLPWRYDITDKHTPYGYEEKSLNKLWPVNYKYNPFYYKNTEYTPFGDNEVSYKYNPIYKTIDYTPYGDKEVMYKYNPYYKNFEYTPYGDKEISYKYNPIYKTIEYTPYGDKEVMYKYNPYYKNFDYTPYGDKEVTYKYSPYYKNFEYTPYGDKEVYKYNPFVYKYNPFYKTMEYTPYGDNEVSYKYNPFVYKYGDVNYEKYLPFYPKYTPFPSYKYTPMIEKTVEVVPPYKYDVKVEDIEVPEYKKSGYVKYHVETPVHHEVVEKVGKGYTETVVKGEDYVNEIDSTVYGKKEGGIRLGDMKVKYVKV